MHVSYTTEEGVRSPDLWVSCQLDEIYNHKKKEKQTTTNNKNL